MPWGQVCGSQSPKCGVGEWGAVAGDIEPHHFLSLGGTEVKRRRKEAVVPPLTSAPVWEVQDLERGCLPEI